KKSIEGMVEFGKTYQHGYLIFGLSPNGLPVTYQGELQDIRIEVDWSNLRVEPTASGRMLISMPTILIQFPNGRSREFYNNLENMPFVENEPIPSVLVPGMYYEVVDAEKRVFLIGFK